MIVIAAGLTLIFLGFFFARREAEKQQKEENAKRAKERLEDAVSFDNDVRLNIELRRARYPVQGGAKPHPQQIGSESKSDWKAMPQSSQVEEPGMNMEHPALRRASNQIDEGDPYAP